MMRSENAIFGSTIAAVLGVGVALGWGIASRSTFETYKLLNVVGQTYSLLGFLVLTELVTNSEQWKRFVVLWVAGVLLWGQMLVPLGAAIGAYLHQGAPSSAKACSFFRSFFICSIPPLAMLDARVFYPRAKHLQDLTARVRRFGFMLLLSGAIVQLLSAFFDFYG